MKRRLALAALLLAAASACTTTENTNTGAGNTNANTNANANANAAASPTPAGVTQADIEAKEHQVWDAIKSKNADALSALLADDFTYVTDDGVHDKKTTADLLKQYELTDYQFSDVKFVKVDEDLAVLVYSSTETSTFGGKPTPESGKTAYNGSAWANRGGKWVAVYHQDSLSEPMQTPPGGNANANAANSNRGANANANASASPAASPAGPPASATDAEKQVWDALKAGNFDAFSGFLADSAIESEPEGVTTKAQSVEAIRHVDFSKAELSDWKEVKLDGDAALVTYLVRAPGNKQWPPAGMRHSTVWLNRGGRFQAYYHQGTTQHAPGK